MEAILESETRFNHILVVRPTQIFNFEHDLVGNLGSNVEQRHNLE